MARIERIDRQLENWARWRLERDARTVGFPRRNILAMFWQPPRHREAVAIIPIDEAEAWTMEQCVQRLAPVLRKTVVQCYLTTGSVADDAMALGCATSTVHMRIEQAHRLLQEMLRELRRPVIKAK